MAIAFVHNLGTAQTKVGALTLVITTSAAASAGNTIIVRAVGVDAIPNASVTDTAGNTYVLDTDNSGANPRNDIWRADNVAALASGSSITVTYSTTFSAAAAAADEFSGVTATSPKDVSGVGSGSSTTPSATADPVATNDLIFGHVSVNGPTGDTYTEDTDSTGGDTWHTLTRIGTSGAGATSNVTSNGAYKIATDGSAQTYNPTLGTSRAWRDTVTSETAAAAADARPAPIRVASQAVTRAAVWCKDHSGLWVPKRRLWVPGG